MTLMPRLLRTALPTLRRGMAAVLFLAVLAIVAMAASPALHEEAHHDADHADHECAVTLFASGSAADQVVTPQVLAGVFLPWVETLREEHAQEVFLARVEGRICERAPPLSAV
jgi:hypothetical protein